MDEYQTHAKSDELTKLRQIEDKVQRKYAIQDFFDKLKQINPDKTKKVKAKGPSYTKKGKDAKHLIDDDLDLELAQERMQSALPLTK